MHGFNWEPMFEKLDQAKLTPHAFSVCVQMPHLCNTCGGLEEEWQHYGPAPDKNRMLPAVEVHPAATLPTGQGSLISKAWVHQGSIIALYGTNDKLIGWIDTYAWTKDRTYRDNLLPQPYPSEDK